MDTDDMNPELQNLKELIGIWEMELSNASFLPDSTTVFEGSASFEWFEGGDFLILRHGSKKDGMPWATWFIGRDKDSPDYTVLYIDDKRSSRVYEMSFKSRIWKIWRNAPKFTQRFTGEMSTDNKLIKGHWEKSTDGKIWHHDFDLTYTKIKNE